MSFCVSRQTMLCDVILVVDGIEVPCHRAVLAACSPYFYAMFTGELFESKADKVVLQDIDGKALLMLVDFMYTSDITVTEENVQVPVRLLIISPMQNIFYLLQ